jgi:mono/diheme cytochrome c family protein
MIVRKVVCSQLLPSGLIEYNLACPSDLPLLFLPSVSLSMRTRSLTVRLLPGLLVLVCASLLAAGDASTANTGIDPDHAAKRTRGLAVFRSQVRSVLKERCVHCHGGDATEGKLDLATREGLLKGGERGPAAVIGRGEKSLLTRLIAHQQEPRMPKDDDKLSVPEIAAIVAWIDLGAPYDEPLVAGKVETTQWTERKVSADRRGLWSYQPMQKVSPPTVRDEQHWGTSPVDRFLLAKLEAANLHPNGPVGRAALIRRLYFDVTGLPPTADEVQAFVDDPRPDAYERLVDQTLASPHYGERWGRRWLDLARFAESHGFEHDYDRQSAFHYRDFVVQALNAGMPYDQFISWQIAGDELAPHDRLAMMATGYLAAGVHSTQITKNEVEKHRYDEMDDMLGTIGTSLLGLTIGCARCHDHKFDAIPQADYYRLLSTFTATIRSEVELDFDPDGYQRAKSEFDREHVPFDQAVSDYEATSLPVRFSEWNAQRDLAAETSTWLVPAGITFRSQGDAVFTQQPDASWLVSGPSPANDLWTITFETKLQDIRVIRLEALADPSFVRSGPGRAPNGNFALSDLAMTILPAGGAADSKPESVKLVSARATFEQNGLPVAAAIDDNAGSAWAVDPEFGKDHAAVFSTAEPFGFEQGTVVTVTLKFNTNVHHSIGRPRLSISQQADLPATVGGARDELIRTLLSQPFDQLRPEEKKQLLDWFKPRDAGWKTLEDRRVAHAAQAPKPRVQKVLVATEGLPPVTLHTQAEAEFLKETHFLRRGETNNKDAVATQGFLQVLMANPDSPQLFQSQPPAGWRTSYQRTSLTNWLTDLQSGAGNLLARVITNRLWQHHLGRGIVATPSDFGARGDLPTHPELLDWLSAELVRGRWELKPVHRLILTSSGYRQSCDADENRAALDRENKLLWHRPRRRLEAEIIRDAILAASDQLNDRLYGPGQLDESHRRRSLYFTVKRSQLIPSMTVFDAPDGTTPVADRPQTTIAPQALLLMNSQSVRDASRQFAVRLLPVAAKSLEEAVRRGYLTAVSRPPTVDELTNTVAFLRQQTVSYAESDPGSALTRSLVDFCQVLFCLNEFIYSE